MTVLSRHSVPSQGLGACQKSKPEIFAIASESVTRILCERFLKMFPYCA